jgi:hypothetical protein
MIPTLSIAFLNSSIQRDPELLTSKNLKLSITIYSSDLTPVAFYLAFSFKDASKLDLSACIKFV